MDLKSTAIGTAIGFVIGGIAIGVPTGLIVKKIYQSPEPAKGQVEEQVISGKADTITHTDWKFKGKSITFDTKSKGTAETKTTVDKQLIPEVKKWDTYVNAFQLSYSGLYYDYDKTYRHVFGVDYYHRWQWFALGIGPRVSYYNDPLKGRIFGGGFNVGMQVWFKGRDK